MHKLSYISGTITGEVALPRIRKEKISEMRLAMTSFVVAVSFLAVSSVHLSHFDFQVDCLTFLLKSYLLTFLYAIAGLTLFVIVAHFIRKESDQDLLKRYRLIAFFVPAMMLVNLTYFTLKAGSVAYNSNFPLILHEYGIWKALRALFASLPHCIYRVLDITYTGVWFASLSALPFSLILLNPKKATTLNSAVLLLLAFTALGNVVLLTSSPVYELHHYFSYLPRDLSTWKIHQASLALSHDLAHLKTALFSGRSAGFFQPVAAFPAFHSGYALLLFLAFRDRRCLRILFLAFWLAIVIGGIVLGYHGFSDTFIASLVALAMFPRGM